VDPTASRGDGSSSPPGDTKPPEYPEATTQNHAEHPTTPTSAQTAGRREREDHDRQTPRYETWEDAWIRRIGEDPSCVAELHEGLSDSFFNFEGVDLARIFRELEDEVLEATRGASRDIVSYFGMDRPGFLRNLGLRQDGEMSEGLPDGSREETSTRGSDQRDPENAAKQTLPRGDQRVRASWRYRRWFCLVCVPPECRSRVRQTAVR